MLASQFIKSRKKPVQPKEFTHTYRVQKRYEKLNVMEANLIVVNQRLFLKSILKGEVLEDENGDIIMSTHNNLLSENNKINKSKPIPIFNTFLEIFTQIMVFTGESTFEVMDKRTKEFTFEFYKSIASGEFRARNINLGLKLIADYKRKLTEIDRVDFFIVKDKFFDAVKKADFVDSKKYNRNDVYDIDRQELRKWLIDYKK